MNSTIKTTRAKVIMLPTEKGSKIQGNKDKGLVLINSDSKSPYLDAQHLYLVSNDDLRKGDWYIFDNVLYKSSYDVPACDLNQKVIATTDSLFMSFQDIKEGDRYKLPKIPDWFIQAYVKAQGKIDEMMVEMESTYSESDMWLHMQHNSCSHESAIAEISKWKIKLSLDNTVVIHQAKSSWTKEEVIGLCRDAVIECNCYTGSEVENSMEMFDVWIKENLL